LNNVQTRAISSVNDVHNPEDRMIKRSRSDVPAAASCAEPDAQQNPVIPVIDLRASGPVEHARVSRSEMIELRDECFSMVPRPLRLLAPALDRLSSAWLARTPSPYNGEIAAISDLADGGGVWFVNASYEWGCTTRVDAEPTPFLRRTLDWPFPGLGRHVEVALQDGGAGLYANVTWPGAVGVLTGVAPGRFAAAINQAPMFRRTRALPLFPLDLALNAVETFRTNGRWPAAHLLRHVFDVCKTFDHAVDVLSSAELAKPVLFSLIGPEPAQSCLIERTQTEAFIRRGDVTIANDWHPASPPRAEYWMPRSCVGRGPDDCERRRRCLQDHAPAHAPAPAFDWVRAPVLNGFTRLAVEASAATGELRVLGFEPTSRWMSAVRPATAVLDLVVQRDGIRLPPAGVDVRRACVDPVPARSLEPAEWQ
jgi:hypothetical protein